LGTELLSILPEERCLGLHDWQARLQSTVEKRSVTKKTSLTSGFATILHKPIVGGGFMPQSAWIAVLPDLVQQGN
jgi:hypothetical protein